MRLKGEVKGSKPKGPWCSQSSSGGRAGTGNMGLASEDCQMATTRERRPGRQHGEGCCEEQWVSGETEVNFKRARAEQKQFLFISKAIAKEQDQKG